MDHNNRHLARVSPIPGTVLFIYLFTYLKNLFILFLAALGLAERRLSLVVASGGYSLLRCVGFLLWWLLFVEEHRL